MTRFLAADGRSPANVFLVFLKLGLTSFGGPVAHLGYFRDELVVRRRWLDEVAYGDLVALCQFLPGPASSQVGFALGILRGQGLLGGLAAWAGFTFPSALFLLVLGLSASVLTGPIATAMLHGLKLVAVAIVAQAVWGMSKSLTPDRRRAGMALLALAIVMLLPGTLGQILAIIVGAALGYWLCRASTALASGHLHFPVSRRRGLMALGLFATLLLALPLLRSMSAIPGVAMFDAFYRSGALVFGGGHVVLPLLRAAVVDTGWVSADAFLAGYGLVQAVPGPLFTFAAYLGAINHTSPQGLLGAAIALIAIFLPGLLLVYGTLPFWDRLRLNPRMQATMRGTNASVVGILGAALYDPIWTSAILSPWDFAMALTGFLCLVVWRVPSWIVVICLTVASVVLGLI